MASDLYSAAFDFARLNGGSVGGANGAIFTNGLTGNIGFNSGMYFHGNNNFPSGTIDGVTLASAFSEAIKALLTGAGKTVTFDVLTCQYTISANAAFTITWTGALGTLMRDILGFTGSATSNATSQVSTVRPDYLIISRVAGQSQVHAAYEPTGRINYAEADDGTAYSTRPSTIATYRDWVQPFETATGPTNAEWTASKGVGGAPMRRTDATTTAVSWSWEDFTRHVRAELPFALLDRSVSDAGPVYKMRGSRAHFDPTRVTADYDGHWSIPFETRYLGASAVV